MSELDTTATYRFPWISLSILMILCALAVGLMGCDGGVGEVAAVDAVATDAAATAATEVAAETAADAVTETAIAGSSDLLLDIGSEAIDVEPYIPALEVPDDAEDLAAGLSAPSASANTTITELDNETTGKLQMMAITTRCIYRAEAAFLDVQHKRLIIKAVEREGEAPTWDSLRLGDKWVSDLEHTKKLEFTAGDGVPKYFVHGNPAGSTGQ
jgi:hypothetical protein